MYRVRDEKGLTGPRTPSSSTSRAFSMGALPGSLGGGRMSVGRSLPPSSVMLADVKGEA